MKSQFINFLAVAFVFTFISACGGGSDVIESGTYEGTIQEVVPEADEIYVNTDQGVLELYFTNSTTLTRNGQTVPFSTLEQGMNVRVEVERVSGELNPLSVEIIE